MGTQLDQKMDLLMYEYPGVDKDALQSLIIACNECLPEVRQILDQSFERRKTPKNSLYQSSILSMMKTKKRKLEEKEDARDSYKLPKPSIDAKGNARRKTKVITLYDDEQIKQYLHPYVSLHRNFLPKKVSDKILEYLLENKHLLKDKKFYLYDKLCQSHSQSTFFYRPEDFNKEDAMYNAETTDIYRFNEDLMDVADRLHDFVNNDIIPKYERLPFQPPKYEVSGCVVNYYQSLSNNLDWHADRLSSMGPHNFITSISLGATREFRLKRHSEPYTVYSIHLPHNCLLIMHPGSQELFKHSVNAMKTPLQLHPICGSERFNLTFRYFPKEFTSHSPKCKCDMPMLLRRSYKNPDEPSFGKYFWTCQNIYQNKDCKTFHWADFSKPEDNFISETDEEASTWKRM